MSYPRNSSDSSPDHEWRRWVAASGRALASGQEFDFNSMTVEQQRALHAFLEPHADPNLPVSGLLAFLRVRAGRLGSTLLLTESDVRSCADLSACRAPPTRSCSPSLTERRHLSETLQQIVL
jgi:hypothetical protein